MFDNLGVIISLDVGVKRVGVAVLGKGQQSPAPLKTLERGGHHAEKEVINLIEELQCELIIVGMPLDDNSLETKECEQIRKFCQRLGKRTTVEIKFFDESYSSFEAKERLGLSNFPERKVRQKGMIDAVSASIILERYLTSLMNQG